MIKRIASAAIVAVFAMPLVAGAAGDKTSGRASGEDTMFKSADKNHDGFISKDEAKGTTQAKNFAALDKNDDGKLSKDEYAAWEHGKKSMGGTSGGAMSSGTTGGSAPKKQY